MITEDYVSFETAKLLKENGFNEPCHALYYDGDDKIFFGLDINSYHNSTLNVDCYACPTLQMAMKWLRNTFILKSIHSMTQFKKVIIDGTGLNSIPKDAVLSKMNLTLFTRLMNKIAKQE